MMRKNNNRGHRNKAQHLKPTPIIPQKRNIQLNWDTYGKLRLIKNKFEFADFDSTLNYLIAYWRKG